MANYSTLDLKLTDAVTEIESGRTRLPDFQRSYVWKENHQKALIDSMQKGYPVGGLLLLQLGTGGSQASPFGEKPFEGVSPTSKLQAPQYLVLDGQQRLTTTFMAFSAKSVTKKTFFVDLKKLFEKTEGKVNETIDFQDFLVSKPTPDQPEALLYSDNLMALPFISLGRAELRAKLHSYMTNLQNAGDNSDFATFIAVALESYLENIFDYQFPCVTLPATLDLEAVANVFTKLNTGGVSLSAFDLCVSKLFPSGENLRTRWDMVKNDDAVKLFDRDGTSLLQTIALLDGKSVKKAGLVNTISKTAVVAYWDQAVGGFQRTFEVLALGGTTGSKTLPYDTLAPALAAALLTAKTPANPPQRAARQAKVERWIIQTAFSQRYTEGSDAKKQIDFPMVKDWFDNDVVPSFLEPIAWPANMQNFQNTGARYKGFLAILNRRSPRDFVQHSIKLGLDTTHQQAQLHHIFPKAWLRSKFPGIQPKDIDRALNLTFLTAESNNHISDNPPSVYLGTLLDEWKLVLPGLSDSQLRDKLKELLREHLIDEIAFEALMSDDYDSFLKARCEILKTELMNMGIPVFSMADSEEENTDTDDQAE
jgi:hypothetical protein